MNSNESNKTQRDERGCFPLWYNEGFSDDGTPKLDLKPSCANESLLEVMRYCTAASDTEADDYIYNTSEQSAYRTLKSHLIDNTGTVDDEKEGDDNKSSCSNEYGHILLTTTSDTSTTANCDLLLRSMLCGRENAKVVSRRPTTKLTLLRRFNSIDQETLNCFPDNVELTIEDFRQSESTAYMRLELNDADALSNVDPSPRNSIKAPVSEVNNELSSSLPKDYTPEKSRNKLKKKNERNGLRRFLSPKLLKRRFRNVAAPFLWLSKFSSVTKGKGVSPSLLPTPDSATELCLSTSTNTSKLIEEIAEQERMQLRSRDEQTTRRDSPETTNSSPESSSKADIIGDPNEFDVSRLRLQTLSTQLTSGSGYEALSQSRSSNQSSILNDGSCESDDFSFPSSYDDDESVCEGGRRSQDFVKIASEAVSMRSLAILQEEMYSLIFSGPVNQQS